MYRTASHTSYYLDPSCSCSRENFDGSFTKDERILTSRPGPFDDDCQAPELLVGERTNAILPRLSMTVERKRSKKFTWYIFPVPLSKLDYDIYERNV